MIFQENTNAEEQRAKRYYAHLTIDDSSEDGYDGNSYDTITVSLPSESEGKREVLSSVLAPYSYTYMAVIKSLESLRDYGLMENDFIKVCVKNITNQVENGNCKYGTYFSFERLKIFIF